MYKRQVYAHAHAARGGQAVLQGGEEILVHVAGLLVAGGLQRGLGLEAAPLVEGVVELAEGVDVDVYKRQGLEPVEIERIKQDVEEGCLKSTARR